ncbi:hypothetical protein RYX36_022785 [Vicia faba]
MPVFYRPDKRKVMPQYQIDAGNKIMQILIDADVNKDGCYTKGEIKKALKDLGSYIPGWRANHCLKKLDANNDGQISGEEIDNLVYYLLEQGFGKKSKK